MSAPVAAAVETEAPDAAGNAESAGRLAAGMSRVRHPVLLLFGLSVCLLLPILIWGLPRTSDDGETHVRWQYFYGRQMWAGDPFPRWIKDIADGFGSPAFFIYPPIPHYVAALLTPVSASVAWVQHRLAAAILLACFLGAVGCYLWLKQVARDRNTALAGAIVYSIAPYHLFVDTYFRGAYAELWALAWAPFALAGMHLLTSRPRAGIALIVLGASGLLMSHAPSALILLPLYLVYACLLAAIVRRTAILVWSGIAACSALLIAGIYLGTALTQQSYIHTGELYTGYFNFYNWLMFAPNPVSKRAFDVSGALQAGLTLWLAGAPLLTKTRHRDWRWLAVATIIGTAILFFMMTSLSAGVWTHMPFAQKIQFPWRLQIAQTLLLALSVALFARAATPLMVQHIWPGKAQLSPWVASLPIALLCVANLVMLHHAPPKFDVAAPIRTLEATEYTLGDTVKGTAAFAGHDKAFISVGSGSIRLLRWEPRHIELLIDAATTTDVLARQFTYTGWTCRGSGGADACQMLSTRTGDILHVRVPPGAQRIDLAMPETVQERAGKLASIAGLMLAAMSIFAAGLRRR